MTLRCGELDANDNKRLKGKRSQEQDRDLAGHPGFGSAATGLLLFMATLAPGLLSPTSLAAQGTPYTYACPTGRAIVGLDGWQGWWMDGVRAVCDAVSVNTGVVGGARSVTRVAGRATGTRREARCPAGHVLTGFTGNRGDYVMTIHSIHCSRVQAGGMAASSGSWIDAFPKKSGGNFLANDCSTGQVATRIEGRADVYLDRFTVGCAYLPGASQPTASSGSTTSGPLQTRTTTTTTSRTAAMTPARVVLSSPSSGATIRGYSSSDPCAQLDVIPPLRWQTATGAASYVLEFRNVTRNAVRRFTSTDTAVSPRLMLMAGNNYSWRVQGVNALGNPGPFSNANGISATAGTSTGATSCVRGTAAYPLF